MIARGYDRFGVPVDPFDDARVPESDFERLVLPPRVIERAGQRRREEFWGWIYLTGALALGALVGGVSVALAMAWRR